ncbi:MULTISPECIES: Ig-like domain-containing protein [Pseudomonas]|uniref:Ig-like domain-containing protein n=1 Tax=Pseudomonas TaxID=286 RepID=UPI00026FE315|nr:MULTISPECIES: Ig-like domain-containing protein [Pseudomonas]EJM28978.1 Ig-like domain-containing protein [Pseudomonas sp. GM25]MCU0089744.1 Ig-like domain-containing protein [Pseudomonas koreensis]
MTTLLTLTKAQLDKINLESPQSTVDLFAEQRSAALFSVDGIRKIFAPQIPGWTPLSYEQARYGVNADQTAGPGKGWHSVFGAYQFQEANDTIRLYRGKDLKPGETPDPFDKGTLIDTFVVPRDHNNEDSVGNIPRSAVQRTTVNEWWCTVERISGNPPESSDRLAILFKTTFPDSRAPSGNTDDRVPLAAPGFPAVIDQSMLANGFVDFIVPAWSIMFTADTIILDINGTIYKFEITAAHIGKDVTVPVPSALLESIGPAEPLLVSYVITDLVNNNSLASAVGAGVLDPDTSYLEAPTVRLSLKDTLKIDDLDHQPMDVDITARRADVVAGDQVELTMLDPASGLSKTYPPIPYRAGLNTVRVPYDDPSRIAPTTAIVSYERIRTTSGSTIHTPSYPYAFRLLAHSYLAPAPLAVEARGAVLSSMLEETLVYFGPDVRGMKLGDKVTLSCLSRSSGGTPRLQTYERYVTEAMEIPGSGFMVPFVWETKHLSTFGDGNIQLSCEVTGDGHLETIKSKVRHLRIAPATHQLEVIEVVKATNDLLDPDQIPFGTSAKCLSGVHTQIGATVRMEVWKNDIDPDKTGELVHIDSLPITAANVGKDVEFRLEQQLIKYLLHNVIRIVWFIECFRSQPLTAPELNLRIGNLVLVLPPPKLLQASPGNVVNPENTQNIATVEVAYPRMSTTHRVTLSCIGRSGFGSPVIASKPGIAGGTMLFDIPKTAFPANMGTFLTFRYAVTQTGIYDQSSSAAKYSVINIDKPELKYPHLTIAESVDNNTLDLNAFSGDAHWTLIAWLFIAIGTKMRVALSGTDSTGNQRVITLFDGTVSANEVKTGLSGTISRAELKKFKDGSQVSGLSIANFSDKGGADTFFPMFECTIKTEMLLKPAITQLIDNQAPVTGSISNGGTCDDQTPELVGTATAGSKVNLFDNGNHIDQATADKAGIWRKTISIALGRHTLTAQTPDGLQQSANWIVTIASDLSIGGDASLRMSEYLIVQLRPPVNPPPGAIYWQQASGGTGSLTYSSSNPSVARIHDSYGRVAVTGDGTTTISVTDQAGRRASYNLTVTGVRNVGLYGPVNWHAHAQGWRPSCLTVWQFQTFWSTYASGGNVPGQLGWPGGIYWTSTNNDYVGGVAWAFNMSNGGGFEHSPGDLNLYTLQFQ